MTIYKVSFIVRAIFPIKSSFAVFLTLIEIANIGRLSSTRLTPSFNTLPMLLIILPVAFILSVVDINEHPVPIGFVVLPTALVDIAICMGHPASSIRLVLLPHAFVLRTIRPELNAYSITIAILLVPLSLVQFSITHIFVLINVNTLNTIILYIVLWFQLEIP